MAEEENLCWYVGAVWNNKDMTDKFISEGYWENGWDDKFTDIVNQIKVGDKISIKSSYTQKNNLPFDIKGETASVMAIKYTGTVTKNYHNGKRVDVEWNKDYKQKIWFFFTWRSTIWKVMRKDDDWLYGALLDFTFNDTKQDYKAFLAHPYWANKYKLKNDDSDIKYLILIDEYKKFFEKNKKAAFDDEVYKWDLLTQNTGKIDVDLINAVRTSKNLIYQSDAATLKTLTEQVPNELIKIVKNLLDESKDLVLRLADFRRDMKTLVQNNLNSTNYAEDERTAADYLTYSYPAKYSFYTNEIYVSYCKYLGIETKKTGEIYPHYCELLHKLESFVSKDDELLEIIANNSSNYIQSDLLLSQNIVYVMLKENYLSQVNGETEMTKAQELANLLEHTHNLILHGAPGTGKTHLAQEIAQAMGAEVGFVQFHPSYDYTDFVEGLRPVNDSSSGQIGFERKDGVFKKFCERALKSLSDNLKSVETLQKEKIEQLDIINNQSDDFFSAYEYVLSIINPNTIKVLGNVNYSVEGQQLKFHTENLIRNVQKDKLQQLFEALKDNPNDIDKYGNRGKQTELLGCTVDYSYYKPILKEMLSYHFENTKNLPNDKNKISYNTNNKPFVFIIDEINRGEMSKIFGELFFAIDPSYRGAEKCRDLRTQYANLQTIPNLFDVALGIKDSDNFGHFFIPENVYIIGTMNDIDRGVESMDFAFRRRFTFKEITAKDTQEQILAGLDESIRDKAIRRMDSLNSAISHIEGLSSAYHIGGAYFLKLKELGGDFGKLWEYHLEGLLREYLRGMEDEGDEFKKLKAAYNLENSDALQC